LPRPLRRTSARSAPRRSLWREVGIGLAVGLVGLVLMAFALKAGSAWPTNDEAAAAFQAGNTIAPAQFAPGSVPIP
jgi:hypothetical protein